METKKEESLSVSGRYAYRFSREEKLSAVRLWESGVTCKEISSRYQISYATLNRWREAFGEHKPVQLRRYTPSQKRAVIRAVEEGMGVVDAVRVFGISSTTVVREWLKRREAENAELSANLPEVKASKKKPTTNEQKALEQQLAEAQLKIRALETMIDIAEEQLKIDIRKKSGAKQSPK